MNTSDNNSSGRPARRLVIDSMRCLANHACPSVALCPVKALSQAGRRAPTVDRDKCLCCGKCIDLCPMEVFSLE